MIRKLQEKLHEGHFRPLDAECARMSTIHSWLKVLKTFIVGFVRRINLLSKDISIRTAWKKTGNLICELKRSQRLNCYILFFHIFRDLQIWAILQKYTVINCLKTVWLQWPRELIIAVLQFTKQNVDLFVKKCNFTHIMPTFLYL